ncbi:hypothetical protein [Sideroxydans sp. CL21]|jgi:hypothetical protein|uniref:hypothetical protein n=1 Tax=Sideroxydans sp. CL21 TaxID=2600596 RepID=UPI0024BCBEA7|nr:hypothetical protein [Sideroxydans sp. CL21]
MNDPAEIFIKLVVFLMAFLGIVGLAHVTSWMFNESKPHGSNRTFAKRSLTEKADRVGINSDDNLI